MPCNGMSHVTIGKKEISGNCSEASKHFKSNTSSQNIGSLNPFLYNSELRNMGTAIPVFVSGKSC
jgi:hypothetical protein